MLRVRDASDRRRNLLSLSDHGPAELDRLLFGALRVNEQLTAGMSDGSSVGDRSAAMILVGVMPIGARNARHHIRSATARS